MEINKIRKVFNKSSVSVSSDGISVFIVRQGGDWASQGIFDDLPAMTELFNLSERIVFHSVNGKFTNIFFKQDTDNRNTVFYPPLEEVIDVTQLLKEMEANGEITPTGELAGFLNGVDPRDEDEILDRTTEFFSAKQEQYYATHTSVNISNIARWDRLRTAVVSIARALGIAFKIDEPDCEFEGSISLYSPENGNPMFIFGKTKELFMSALEICGGIEFECNIDEGFYNIVFYV